MLITTERLSLRPLQGSDADAFHTLIVDPVVREFLFDGAKFPREGADGMLAQSQELFRSEGAGLFAVRLHSEPTLMGFAGLWYFHEPPELELGYALSPAYQGKGYATEAGRAIVEYAWRTLRHSELGASVDVPNVASHRVLARLGFVESRRSQGPIHELIHYIVRNA